MKNKLIVLLIGVIAVVIYITMIGNLKNYTDMVESRVIQGLLLFALVGCYYGILYLTKQFKRNGKPNNNSK